MAKEDLVAALHSIQRDSSRQTAHFDDAEDGELFDLLAGFFYGGYSRILEQAAIEQKWAKHVVSPPIPCRISARMFIVDGMRGTRLLVGNTSMEHCFPAPEFDEQLKRIRERLDSE